MKEIMDLFQALKQLSEARDPVGFEQDRANVFMHLASAAAQDGYEITPDKFGNVICHKPGIGQNSSLCAH